MHGPASHDVARHGREQGGNDSQKRIPQKEAPGRGGLLKVPAVVTAPLPSSNPPCDVVLLKYCSRYVLFSGQFFYSKTFSVLIDRAGQRS